MNTSTAAAARTGTSRPRSRGLRVAGALVVAFLVFWAADSALASRAEAALSAGIEEASDLRASPRVYLGGFPFAQVLLTEELPDASVDSLDVDIAGLGIANTRTELHQVSVSPAQALRGDIVGAPAEMLLRRVSLDGVAFGQLLDMTDLDISHPYDISPGGGVAAEAQLTGTPPGFEEQISGLVTLRLDGPEFHMEVVDVLTAPASRLDDAEEALTLSFDTRRLPLGGQASAVSVGGGSISFEAQRFNTVVAMSDLAAADDGASALSD